MCFSFKSPQHQGFVLTGFIWGPGTQKIPMLSVVESHLHLISWFCSFPNCVTSPGQIQSIAHYLCAWLSSPLISPCFKGRRIGQYVQGKKLEEGNPWVSAWWWQGHSHLGNHEGKQVYRRRRCVWLCHADFEMPVWPSHVAVEKSGTKMLGLG